MTEIVNNSLLEQAVKAFDVDRASKSFSGRHPELGKMINCPVCDLRHRVAHVCTPVYATVPGIDGHGNDVDIPLIACQETRKGIHGAVNFKGRILKHRNAWSLQVLERATKIYRQDIASFPNASQTDKDKMGKSSLSRALNEKRAERAQRRKTLLHIIQESRRINRGL